LVEKRGFGMSAKAVFALRKEGKVSEAYDMAKSLIKDDPKDMWNVRALAWVLVDKFKQALSENKPVNSVYDELQYLSIPKDDSILNEQIGWVLCKYLFHLPPDQNSSHKINQILRYYAHLHNERPSKLHSAILNAVVALSEHYSDKILEFIKWWGLENFREEDFLGDTNEDGDKFPSLYVKTMRVVGKVGKTRVGLSPEMLEWLLSLLEDAIQRSPEEEWLPYYHGQILITTGNILKAQEELLPVIRKRMRDFWAWDLMADLCVEPEDKRACLCKAVTCETQDRTFLVNVYQKLADVFWVQGQSSEAAYSLAQALQIRKSKGWKLTAEVLRKEKEYGVDSAENLLDNKIYRKYACGADALLIKDLPEVIGVISRINSVEKITNIIFGSDKKQFALAYHDSFPLAGQLEVGQTVVMRTCYDEKHERHRVLSFDSTTKEPNDSFYHIVKGKLRHDPQNPFAFVGEDIFVPPYLVKNHKLENGMMVSGAAIREWNDKKSDYVWKLLCLVE